MSTSANSKLISVIVPVYNVEHFLDHCVETILAQTYSNFELILVDDGSTDSSGQLCDQWIEKDNRIRVKHQKNGGLSAARNSGMEMAKGEYICFIDSDDFVTIDYLADFIETMGESDIDFAICDIVSSKLTESDNPITTVKELSQKACMEWLSNPISREYVLMVVSWNKMYKREFLIGKRFEHGKLHEDEFMINDLIFSMRKAAFIPKANYVYRVNEESITGKGNAGNINHLHGIEAYEDRIKKALENGEEDFAAITLKNGLLKLCKYYSEGDGAMKEASQKMFEEMYGKYVNLFSEKQKLKYKFFEIAPKLFCKIFV